MYVIVIHSPSGTKQVWWVPGEIEHEMIQGSLMSSYVKLGFQKSTAALLHAAGYQHLS